MKRSKQAREALKAIFHATTTSKSKAELLVELQSRHSGLKDKHLSKALHKLLARGFVERDGEDLYYWVESESSSGDEETQNQPLPIAEILRRKVAVSDQSAEYQPKGNDEMVDIDEEIRRLEAELAKEEGDGSDDESDAQDDEPLSRRVRFGEDSVSEIEAHDAGQSVDEKDVLCFSEVAAERIEPLPSTCLPQNKRRKLKGIDESAETVRKKKPKKVTDGLEDAVKEVLSGYVARSAERLPFYCRVCAQQYANEKDFFEHRSTEFHRKAVELERKASYCKLCRKQFTSLVQLREHLSSRPHKDRLAAMKSSQSSRSRSEFNPRRHGRSPSGKEVPGERGKRQWC